VAEGNSVMLSSSSSLLQNTFLAISLLVATACGTAASQGEAGTAATDTGSSSDGDGGFAGTDDVPAATPATAAAGRTTDDQCDDKNVCTDDTCKADGTCKHGPLDGKTCDDGSACTTGDKCQDGKCAGTGSCPDAVAGCKTDDNCDDGNPCTDDT